MTYNAIFKIFPCVSYHTKLNICGEFRFVITGGGKQ